MPMPGRRLSLGFAVVKGSISCDQMNGSSHRTQTHGPSLGRRLDTTLLDRKRVRGGSSHFHVTSPVGPAPIYPPHWRVTPVCGAHLNSCRTGSSPPRGSTRVFLAQSLPALVSARHPSTDVTGSDQTDESGFVDRFPDPGYMLRYRFVSPGGAIRTDPASEFASGRIPDVGGFICLHQGLRKRSRCCRRRAKLKLTLWCCHLHPE